MKRILVFLVLVCFLVPMVGADYTDPDLAISKNLVTGHWKIHKFGHNEGLSTDLETIWSGSNIYTYPPAATIMNLTSTDADDNMGGTGAWGVTVYGLDGNYDMINETMQLNGLNPIPTTLKYLRVYRMFIRQSGTTGFNEGIIYLGTGASAAGVPTNKYAIIDQNYGQTMMTQFTIPNGYTGYLKRFTISCYTTNKNFESYLRIRWIGESWRRIEESNMIAGSSLTIPYEPPLPIQAKTDIEFIGKVDVAGGFTEVNYDLILVKDGYSLITNPTLDVNIAESEVDYLSNSMILWLVFITMGSVFTTGSRIIQEKTLRTLSNPIGIIMWVAATYIYAINFVDTAYFPVVVIHLLPILLHLTWAVNDINISSKVNNYE